VPSRLGIHTAARRVALAVLGVISCCWLSLYLDSVHQRRRAERLIAELKSFPFSTAGFLEVRGLANNYGGTTGQHFPLFPLQPPGLPMTDSQGQVQMPLSPTGLNCTPQDCTFEIWIRPHPSGVSLSYRAAVLLLSSLAYSGVRPWVVYARFEIKNGRLAESRTSVVQVRRARIGAYEGVFPLDYEVKSRPLSPYDAGSGYGVGVPHVTGWPTDILSVRVAQTANAPIRRAFDIDIRCFTAVWRSCRGFGELAPSAWADLQARVDTQMKDKPAR